MQRTLRWMAPLALSVGLFAPGAISAQTLPGSAVIGNGVISLGVNDDASFDTTATGLQFAPTRVEGLARLCACSGWSLALGAAGLEHTVGTFTPSASMAQSSALVHDAASDSQLRVTHDFHATPGSNNLYEAVVTITNLGSATVQPGYARTLGWANGVPSPSLAMDPSLATVQVTQDGQAARLEVGVPPIEPGGSQVFRLYFGAGLSPDEARAGLQEHGASVVSDASIDATAFVFAYAPGAAPTTAAGNGGGGNGGNGGGGGNDSGSTPSTAGSTGGGSSSKGGGGGGGGGGARHSSDPVNDTVPAGSSALPLVHTDSPGQTSDLVGPNTGRGNADVSPQPHADQAGGPSTSEKKQSDANNAGTLGNNTGGSGNNAGTVGNNAGGIGGNDLGGPALQATPELDSLALMGSGLAGLGAYGLMRLRARRPVRGQGRPEGPGSESKHQDA